MKYSFEFNKEKILFVIMIVNTKIIKYKIDAIMILNLFEKEKILLSFITSKMNDPTPRLIIKFLINFLTIFTSEIHLFPHQHID